MVTLVVVRIDVAAVASSCRCAARSSSWRWRSSCRHRSSWWTWECMSMLFTCRCSWASWWRWNRVNLKMVAESMCTWASSWRWSWRGRRLAVVEHVFDELHFCIQLGVEVVHLVIKVVLLGVDWMQCAFPILVTLEQELSLFDLGEGSSDLSIESVKWVHLVELGRELLARFKQYEVQDM